MRFEVLGCPAATEPIAAECQKPAGLESLEIPSASISASSEYDDQHGARRGRLNLTPDSGGIGAWAARSNDRNQWIQVNLGQVKEVTGVITQGRNGNYDQWVTSYEILYGMDGNSWQPILGANGQAREFVGNFDKDTQVRHLFPEAVIAKYIRIHPLRWNGHISMRFEVLVCLIPCIEGLGMESGAIPSASIKASSEYNVQHGPRRARLNLVPDSDGIGAWAAKTRDLNQWIQVDLGKIRQVSGVVTQGRNGYSPGQWVESYKVSYSIDATNWEPIVGNAGVPMEFVGNSDTDTAVTRLFAAGVHARFIRIHPLSWNGHISMRFEVLGCPVPCIDGLGMESGAIPSASIKASSEYNAQHGPRRGRLNLVPDSDGIGAWAAKTRDLNQWIQVDLGKIRQVSGVVTQGRNGYSPGQWVESYKVSYSMDANKWEPIVGSTGVPMEFVGNSDTDTAVTRLFPAGVHARFIRIHPLSWNGHISMRFEVLGCPVPCIDGLGMESGAIQSASIKASSKYNAQHGPRRARLNLVPDSDGIGAWAAKTRDLNQWIQVDLGKIRQVSGVVTQGRNGYSPGQWVKSYKISYSMDANKWEPIVGSTGVPMEFVGNSDTDTAVTRLFPAGVHARFIRIHPLSWNGHISMRFEVLGCPVPCIDGLGMESGAIPSASIKASSEYNAQHGPRRARLNLVPDSDGIGAWAAKTSDLNQWIQVDLGKIRQVSGVVTQGRNGYSPGQWVQSYKVSYSIDSNNWEPIVGSTGVPMEFVGNSDADTAVTRLFPAGVHARFIRIHPLSWNGHISMRFEVLGCPVPCIDGLGMESGAIPSASIKASSEYNAQHGPRRARLNLVPDSDGIGAWAAKTSDHNQWIQVDLGKIRQVSGVVTQGRNGYTPGQWVQSYKVSYSIDSNNWEPIVGSTGVPMEFVGNSDADTAVTRLFPAGVHARFIRIHPLSWNGHISMRFEVLGCPVADETNPVK
ncbi:uncharacterized protein LOC117109513 isoform X2 [Anneissia japonica]|uniref:uncharacterized protein LOC117109513 isoform X2 n=1 Tax=Anneissia japonica TaxID=1529436 RepID=UPI0014255EC9|nr:uncharacterized protein LOC117109513 isoform X2 [Anneissia japonica]